MKSEKFDQLIKQKIGELPEHPVSEEAVIKVHKFVRSNMPTTPKTWYKTPLGYSTAALVVLLAGSVIWNVSQYKENKKLEQSVVTQQNTDSQNIQTDKSETVKSIEKKTDNQPSEISKENISHQSSNSVVPKESLPDKHSSEVTEVKMNATKQELSGSNKGKEIFKNTKNKVQFDLKPTQLSDKTTENTIVNSENKIEKTEKAPPSKQLEKMSGGESNGMALGNETNVKNEGTMTESQENNTSVTENKAKQAFELQGLPKNELTFLNIPNRKLVNELPTVPAPTIKVNRPKSSLGTLRVGIATNLSRFEKSIGLAGQYFITPRWSVSSGLLYGVNPTLRFDTDEDFKRDRKKEIGETYNPGDFPGGGGPGGGGPGGRHFKDISIKRTTLDLPITLQYYIPFKNKLALFPTLGASFRVLEQHQVSLKLDSLTPDKEKPMEFRTRPMDKEFVKLFAGIGVEKSVGKFTVQAIPTVGIDKFFLRPNESLSLTYDLGIKLLYSLN